MSDYPNDLNPDGELMHWAALELLKLRKDLGRSAKEVGVIIGRTEGLVSKLEHGKAPLQPDHAALIDKAWGTHGRLTRIVRLAKSAHSSSWTEELDAIADQAIQVRIWSLGWVPAILQTEEYARATFIAARRPDVEAALEHRRKRQAVLSRQPVPAVRAIIAREALEVQFEDPNIQREQLDHLIALAKVHTIRILELGAGPHVGRDGSFVVYTTPDGKNHPYTSTVGPGRLIEDPNEITGYVVSFDHISDKARNDAESLEVLHDIREAVRG